METLSAIGKLDKALSIINHCDKPPFITDGEILKRLNEGLANPITAKQLIEILYKIKDDKMCLDEVSQGTTCYFSSFEGQLLEEAGGYTTKFKNEASQTGTANSRNRYLYWISVSIGLSTSIAALYYFLEVLRVQYHLGLPHHVLFQ
ncbi:MAG: hypothetical protein JWO03_3862 [Bacteroidetes bacterium]|nr:hypothetical protein [Bacteroidota bacterium]